MTAIATSFLPIAPPVLVDSLYLADQHRRVLDVLRREGPWSLILAQYFSSPEEVIATTTGGALPDGAKPTWDMFLNPIFRTYLAKDGVNLYPELDDCFYNRKFLDLVRAYWNTPYVECDQLMANMQGPSSMGGAPHVDGTHFRGLYSNNAPTWLLNTMAKSGLFRRWQAKKGQVIAWYYQGTIGGGFHYWPEGPRQAPRSLNAPMWGHGVVVENEMMWHTAEGCGPVDQRRPAKLDISSTLSGDPDTPGAWRIMTGDQKVAHIPEQEFRLLLHWNAMVYKDLDELKLARDHTDDITVDMAFEILVRDLNARGEVFEMPSDPLHDTDFIDLLGRVYDLGRPHQVPADPTEPRQAA